MADNCPVIYATEHFTVKVPVLPHIRKQEGGHIFIEANDHSIEDRWQLPIDQIYELAWLCAVAAPAFKETMEESGIPIYNLNLQDNGNWSFARNERPVLHIHIYGRSDDEKRDDTDQSYGQSLAFPYSETGHYDDFDPIDDLQIKKIAEKMESLAKTEQFVATAPACLYSAASDK